MKGGASAAGRTARHILAWIRREGKPTFTRRDCHAAHKHRLPKANDLQEPLDVLTERHYARQVPKPVNRKGGRPSTVYEVNPAAFHEA